MNFLTLVLLLLALSGCSSEVVADFKKTCPDFFANPEGTLSPPTVFTGDNYKQICQILGNTYEYATLYDTANKIPVYSAYKFEGLMGCKRQSNWYIEPQLEDRNLDRKMAYGICGLTQLAYQAVNEDYKDSDYDRGHLAPVYHARSQHCSDATFTLTNAAPQNRSFNRGQWKKTEEAVAKTLKEKCEGNSAYIVTGVVPGTDKLKNRVRIPSYFWTAYCCLDNNQRVKAASGFIGGNINNQVQEMSVGALDAILSILYDQKVFKVFGGMCNEFNFGDFYWFSVLEACQTSQNMKECFEMFIKNRSQKS
ncbi:endonuclease domain-containing 1 protein-like [Pygocentrus nattereri]|uniref:Endonuclease domain-containing 1 protein-like n=1 Tax=Pygocentrus nattereri TaxID=42514 RepID=A0AAR2IZD9_PYGNA|nr:endonuclease domain-containing 1 protein-like [Pygocentrus nattereri]XP_017572791.1 endonuclease domain-containing 1 protein-like [Pygocentrus nattereri]XP_017572792.1 endonuclease domain-containing 1 protein-like [Pygocentrus nattereri]